MWHHDLNMYSLVWQYVSHAVLFHACCCCHCRCLLYTLPLVVTRLFLCFAVGLENWHAPSLSNVEHLSFTYVLRCTDAIWNSDHVGCHSMKTNIERRHMPFVSRDEQRPPPSNDREREMCVRLFSENQLIILNFFLFGHSTESMKRNGKQTILHLLGVTWIGKMYAPVRLMHTLRSFIVRCTRCCVCMQLVCVPLCFASRRAEHRMPSMASCKMQRWTRKIG